MIKIEMTVEEMLDVHGRLGVSYELKKRIADALKEAVGRVGKVEPDCELIFYKLQNPDNFIKCIKIIRVNTGLGLKEAKDFMDVVRGDCVGTSFRGGVPNRLKGYTRDVCHKMLNELRDIGEWDTNAFTNVLGA